MLLTPTEKLRNYHHRKALEIQVVLETDNTLSLAERAKLTRKRKMHRKHWRHHAKIARQQRDRARGIQPSLLFD